MGKEKTENHIWPSNDEIWIRTNQYMTHLYKGTDIIPDIRIDYDG
jgi:hypothetical protein